MRPGRSLAALACTALLSAASAAQDASGLTGEFGNAARERLAEPGVLERTSEHRVSGRLARLLEDLHLQFKTFESATGNDLGLGFSYDFVKSLRASDESSARATELVASGNVAFDQDTNPDDFLVTALRMRWFGTRAFGAGESRAARVETLPDPGVDTIAAFDPQRFAALAARFAQSTAAADVRADPDFQALARSYFETVERELPPELIWDFALQAAYESNQDFSSRQLAFGASLGGRLVSWDPESSLSKWNVFDFPAAAVRWLAGQDEDFRASGEAYPTLVTGLDLVEAARVDERSAVTDDENYLRLRLEAGLKSPVLDLEDERLFLSAAWRFYDEIDAPAAVRRADVDTTSYLQVQLDLPRGWALTYSTGRLPLDAENDSTFALGFQVHF